MWDDGHTQGGGVIWRRGGVDDMPSKVNALILTEDGSDEDGGGDFLSMCNGVCSESARPVCAPNSLLGVW
jgi:hypothetical protein